MRTRSAANSSILRQGMKRGHHYPWLAARRNGDAAAASELVASAPNGLSVARFGISVCPIHRRLGRGQNRRLHVLAWPA
jgi:hypothetical protein